MLVVTLWVDYVAPPYPSQYLLTSPTAPFLKML
jgi:hypothetical protein